MIRPRSDYDREREKAASLDDPRHDTGIAESASKTLDATTALENPAELPSYARAGYVLAGKYRVERLLGQGGMGVVVVARHLQLLEPVAIKFLLPRYHDAESIGRFIREAWAATKIKSEHVVRVTDVATLPEGPPYIVMEYLDGEDLASALRRSGPLGVEQAIEFVLQVCEALAEAHALGIVHRDLKPSNVFKVMRSDGLLAVKVLDFGISKISHASLHALGHAITTSAVTMGSPPYMSPEQMRSTKDVDLRTDIWALGVIAYEILAGRPPFSSTNIAELAVQIATERPASLRSLRRDVPRRLERVIGRCLEKLRDERYADVGELARDLAEFAPIHARSHADRAVRVLRASSPKPLETIVGEPTHTPVSTTRRTAAITLALALTAALPAWWWFAPSRPSPVEPIFVPAATVGPSRASVEPPPAPPIAPTRVPDQPPAEARAPSISPPAPTVESKTRPAAPKPRRRIADSKRTLRLDKNPDEELGGRM